MHKNNIDYQQTFSIFPFVRKHLNSSGKPLHWKKLSNPETCRSWRSSSTKHK